LDCSAKIFLKILNLPSLPSGASTVLDYSIDNTSGGGVNTYDFGQDTGIFTK
jgi:hypothetical protein